MTSFKVCINPAYQPRELTYALNKVGVRAIVSESTYGGRQSFSNSSATSVLEQLYVGDNLKMPVTNIWAKNVAETEFEKLFQDLILQMF